VGILAVARPLLGWLGRQAWSKLDDRLGLAFTGLMDLQLLVGLILYVGLSPVVQEAFSDLGAAMAVPAQRFFAVEHIFYMVIAVVLAHVGRAVSRRAAEAAKHKRAALWYGLSLVAILIAIPWPWLFPDRPWFRLG
jgi:hypothetical protein